MLKNYNFFLILTLKFSKPKISKTPMNDSSCAQDVEALMVSTKNWKTWA